MYYTFMDRGKITDSLSLFTDDIEYERAGKNIVGKDKLKEFYLTERKIIGEHIIFNIFTPQHQLSTVFVEGTFKFNNNTIINFVDIFEFNSNKIAKRKTFLNSGFKLLQ